MFNLERWQEIFEAISKNKLRTILTGVSVASGIFILVILLGAGKGIENGIQKQFEQDAVNRISVWTNVTTKEYKGLNLGRRIQLHNLDFDNSVRQFGENLENKSSVYSIWSGNVVFGKETGTYRVEGVHPDYQFIENAGMLKGRFINYSDLKNFEKSAVIGNKVSNDIFKKGEQPLGQKINIAGGIYTVVGVFTDPGGEREESRVFLPISTAQKAFSAGDTIRSLAYTLAKRASFDQAVAESDAFAKQLGVMLRKNHTVAPDDEGAITIHSSLEEAKKVYMMTDIIRYFFWTVGILTIIAGVVGVGNIMLIIVKERTKEIGIRKALGAPPLSIITMILQESVFVTTIAGFTGLLFGMLVWEFIGPMVQSDFFYHPEVDFNIAITTLLILVIAGAFAGFIPAYRAAKIKPIIALRDE